MLSGKAQAASRPTAMGTLIQQNTYGATIPVIYGITQSSLYGIWAANLRQGGPGTKKFKQDLKGVTNYIENIDFLLGHNPIMGVLQMWNNGSPIPLNFVNVTLGGSGQASYTIADPYFYALIGVTVDTAYSDVVFNDYGGQGPQVLSGTYATPCWNTLFSGPAWISQQRNFPYTYRWEPSYGATFYLDGQFYQPSGGTVTAYYAQLKAATSYKPPIIKEFCFFEPQLGDGPEYVDAGNDPTGNPYTDQQVIYPMFAGMGSSNIDLGAAGVLPQLQAEVHGKWSLYSTGDGDFADMIEDVFRSGVAQAAIGDTSGSAPGFSQVEHGLSGYSFPGCVQNQFFGAADGPFPPVPYNQPNTQGNFLVVVAVSGDGTTLGVSDSAGNTYTPVLASGIGVQVWWAQVGASGPNTVTFTGFTNDSGGQLFEIAGVDTFDSATVGTSPSVSQVTTNQQGFPAFIMAVSLWFETGTFNTTPLIPQWTALNEPSTAYGVNAPGELTFSRVVKTPGTYTFTMPQPSFNPTSICSLAFKCALAPPANPAPVGDFIDNYSLDLVRLQCRANGLWGSLTMNSQQAASDWLETLYQAADAAPVFMGFKLFSVPYSEVSVVGNGAVYNAPTACGPVANLSTENGDFIAQSNAAPVTIKTAARVDQPNVLQMQVINRESNYNPTVVEQPDALGISLWGIRKADPVVNNAIQDVGIARNILGIMVRKLQYGGDIYSFSLPAKWALLSPMDLVTITDPLADFNQIPVRITSIAEDPTTGQLQCEAEPFVYGMYAPLPYETQVPGGTAPGTGTTVAPVNPPIIFEPVPGLIGSANQGQVWLVISDPDPSFGGAQVFVSTDGGSSYVITGSPTVGNAPQGVTVGDWPAASSPDTTNNLSLDMTESAEALPSYSVADEDGFVYPCYVESGGATPEIRGSGIATSTSATITIAFPAGSAVGDLAVLIVSAGYTLTTPSGWSVQYETFGGDWSTLVATKTLTSGDISAGGVSSSVTNGVSFDMAAGMAVFIGGGVAGVRETQGMTTSGGGTVVNTTTSAVTNSDVAIYWASTRQPSAVVPIITPAVGSANTLHSDSTTNAYSLLADQAMPGGALSVGTLFPPPDGGDGEVAVQVIVQAAAPTQIPYELMTYAVATLTSPNMYTLSATGGNHLNRGVFGAPLNGVGVDHPTNSQFALLLPSGQGIAKLPLLPAWIGETIYFKIIPYNTFGVASGTLSDATAYPYIVVGTSGTGAGGALVNGS